MKTRYDFKYFEFSKNDFQNPKNAGGFDIYQVGELEMSANACIEKHKQICHEISYIISGEGTFTTGDKEIPIKSGDIHIISKDEWHTIKSSKSCGLRFAFLGFGFNCDFHDLLPASIKELFNQSPTYVVSDSSGVGKLFAMLIDESYSNGRNSEKASESLITYILILAQRLFSGTEGQKFFPEKSARFIGQPLYDIIRFIDKSTPNCPSVREICEKFSYSESYISHLFKKKLGVGISEYITESRLSYSEMLLFDDKHSISEIARIIGYGSLQSFCKAFRKKHGQTPTQYKQARKKRIGTHD
ncbi:MAG: helix-turn-helix transcriptional regulator [Clostridia bacterium]|nr:helix-turn-helix transcriptional regulator [Clostridia bacterium]